MKRQKKSIKNHCKDILLVIGASSVALASCSKPYVEGLTYDNFAENLDEGLSLIPIDVYLTLTYSVEWMFCKKSETAKKILELLSYDS